MDTKKPLNAAYEPEIHGMSNPLPYVRHATSVAENRPTAIGELAYCEAVRKKRLPLPQTIISARLPPARAAAVLFDGEPCQFARLAVCPARSVTGGAWSGFGQRLCGGGHRPDGQQEKPGPGFHHLSPSDVHA
ncbi:MAG: hypothetical protein HOO93_13220 [Methyloglobulus sp.]|nr:hypothetical protein [Methyloglobulus sp.]